MPWFRSKSVSDGSEDKSSKNSQPDSTEQAAVPEMGNTGEKTDNSHVTDTHTDVKEYPGLKIVLPIVLSVCLVVFLAALVSHLKPAPVRW